ncbi:MAG TPA: insulinase family protein [Candidatus Paceibacterota bacterium]|nr:insulinase family protein [Candidatus Paceibacterota bacterium]
MKIKDLYAEFRHEKLENGLSIYHLKTDDNFTYVTFNFNSGGSSDPLGREGTAHFVEHLIGEKAPISKEALQKLFENSGGDAMLGTTWSFMTRYSFKIPTRKDLLQTSLFLFGEMLLKGKIVSGVEKHRQIILNEYTRRNSLEEIYNVWKDIYSKVFPGTFCSRALSSLGTTDFINSATKEELNEFYQKHYILENMNIVSCGNLDFNEMKEIVLNSVFGEATPLSGISIKKNNEVLLQPFKHTENTFNYSFSEITKSETKLTSCGYNAYALLPYDTEKPAGLILSRMLSEALFSEIREKQNKTYDIHAEHRFDKEANYISINCKSFESKFYGEIIDSILNVIDTLEDNEELFLSAINKGRNIIFMNEASSSTVVNGASEEIALYGRIVKWSEFLDFYDSVSMNDINNLLKYVKGNYLFHVLSKP